LFIETTYRVEKGEKWRKQIWWMGAADSSTEASLAFLFQLLTSEKPFHLSTSNFRALFTDTTRSYNVRADGYSFRIVNPQAGSKLDRQMMGNYRVNRLFGLRVSGMNSTWKFPKFEGVFCQSETDAGKQLACPHILLFGQVFLSSYDMLNLIAS
jgi:hypothetical protein